MRSEDVVIVGGGFAGLSTAWQLAARGIRAIVLEREAAIGLQTSGRGAGLGRQLTEDDDTSRLAIRGAALLRERFASRWQATGGLLSFDDVARYEVYVARARRLDVACEAVDHARVVRHWPELAQLPVAAALFVPRDGLIATHGLLRDYAEGVAVETGVEARRVEDGRIETANGTIRARCVVDASGAWAGAITQDPPLDVFKRHLFTLEAAAAHDAPYIWHLGAHELYLRPRDGVTLACACDAEATPAIDQQPNADADALLIERLAGARITQRWACQRAFAPDRKMRIGRDPSRPWLVWAAALGGHGATASAAVGERAATAVQEVLDERA